MRFIQLTRRRRGGAVREMASGREVHAENGIPRGKHREINRLVCLGPGIGLHVRVFRAEKLLCPVYGKLFYLIAPLHALIKSFARIPFRVLIGKNGTLRLQYGLISVVLRSYHKEVFPVSFYFLFYDVCDILVDLLYVFCKIHGKTSGYMKFLCFSIS